MLSALEHASCSAALLSSFPGSSLSAASPAQPSLAVVGAALGPCCHAPPLGLLEWPLRETGFHPAWHHSQNAAP